MDNESSIDTLRLESKREIDILNKRIRGYRYFFMITSVASCIINLTVYPNLSYVKDTLKVTPAEMTLFSTLTRLEALIKPLIGYIEDKYSPFGGYKIKFFTSLSSVCLIFIYLYIWIAKPGIILFSVLMVAKGVAASIGDTMAQGMTVVTLKYQLRLSKLDPSSTKTHEGLNYGYQKIVSNMARIICVYCGGVMAGNVDIGVIYFSMIIVPVLTLLYTFVIFKEDIQYNLSRGFSENELSEVRVVEQEEEEIKLENEGSEIKSGNNNLNFKEKLTIMWKIFKHQDLLFPLIITNLSSMIPSYGELQIYIMTDPSKGGWSYKSIALCALLSGGCYLPIIFHLLPKILAKGDAKVFTIATTFFGLYSFTQFVLLYTDMIHFYLMFVIIMIMGTMASCGTDLTVIPIGGKFSKKCPKGLENFGLTCITTMMTLFSIIGDFLSAPLLSWFDVQENNYDNLIYLLILSFSCRIGIISLIPIFIR